MNREQYMKMLRRKLKHLPKNEFEKAIEYFEEYFAEAGIEHEQQAIEDLGTPDEAAANIIQNMAVKNTLEPIRDMKKGVKAVWIGILAVFAVPVALPVLLMAAGVALMLFAAVLLVLILLMTCCVFVIIMGPVYFFGGCTMLAQSIPVALVCFGQGLACIGIGLLLGWGLYLMTRKFLNWAVKAFGAIVKKGGKNA